MPSDETQLARAAPESAPHGVLAHDLMVGDRLRLYAYARYFVILLMLGAGLFAVDLMGVEGLSLGALLWLAAGMLVYNTVFLVLSFVGRDPEHSEAAVGRLKRQLAESVLLDFLALTVAVWIVGGARSPLLGCYLFHLVVTAFLLPRRSALLTAALAIALLGSLVLGELAGIIPAQTPVGLINSSEPLSAEYALTVLGVYWTLFVLVSVSATGLVARLRAAERESQHKTLELARLSAMRRQFLLLALHNLNSPIAAATMLLRNLHSGMLGELSSGHKDQLERAMKRLDGMGEFLADLRKISELERADLHEHSTEVSLEFLLGLVFDEYRGQAEARRQTLTAMQGSQSGLVFGVPRLLRETLANYVTNAIKYTADGGEIVGRVVERGDRVRAEVTDNGVGIAPEDTERLFEEFVRVGRTNPAIKHVKGSGLGLALVKRIAEAHAGTVGVDSTPGAGSTFWIELPACGSPDAPTEPVSPASP